MFFGHDTVYSAGYSDSSWKRVEKGMPQSGVRKLLGEPLTKTRDGLPVEERWDYSTNGESSENFHTRFVEFRDGKVSHKCSDFTIE